MSELGVEFDFIDWESIKWLIIGYIEKFFFYEFRKFRMNLSIYRGI